MSTKSKKKTIDKQMILRAVKDSFFKLSPKTQAQNPVMLLVYISAILTTILFFLSLFAIKDAGTGYTLAIAIILWITSLFANFAEAIAEGRGKAQADSLRKAKKYVEAHKIPSLDKKDEVTPVPSVSLKKGDLVIVRAGEQIPADGEAIDGAASVDESAITGESAPVIRESGGDRSAVTGGTTVISDWLVMRVTNEAGNSFLDKMIAMVEGAERKKTPNEIALQIFLVALSIIFILVTMSLYAPIEGSNGWSVCINAPVKDFTGGVKNSIYVTIIIAIASIAAGLYFSSSVARKISQPISLFKKRLAELAKGDVSSAMPEIPVTSAEMLSLKKSIYETVTNTNDIIKDIDYVLGEMAAGNFRVDSTVENKYLGDYKNILVAERKINRELTNTLLEIVQVSEQVSAGSNQVSSGAQSLAQGSTEQASAVEELAATISQVAQQIKNSAEDSQKANKLTREAEEIMQGSVHGMSEVEAAMDEISVTSQNISKVIKVIDDIAFQTNILALNAAVEAARAGEAGKGFAVVADEVRNLSQKSSEAAKNTAVLIESSIAAVEKGGKLVKTVSEDFALVAKKSSEVGQLVNMINEQSQQQADAVSQISVGVDQVSSVVQMNTATSEESAAASEELSSQAEALKGLVEQFKLSDN